MDAFVVNIGSELLSGRTLNRNLISIAKAIRKYGFEIKKQISLPDDREFLLNNLKNIFNTFNGKLIILTGGLGPTEDDITSQIIADSLDLEMILNEKELERIKNYYKALNRDMPNNNLKQAYFPKGSSIIINNNGTASGFKLQYKSFDILALPGPPAEMLPMLNNYLESFIGDPICNYTLNLIGKGESLIETEIRKLDYDKSLIEINTYVDNGLIDINFEYGDKDKDYAKSIIEKFKKVFAAEIFYENMQSPEYEIVKKLNELKKTLTIAESMTGGLIAEKITSIPNASRVLLYGAVTYTELAKHRELNVSEESLDKFSAVSHEVCLEMLNGLKNKYNSDYRISITGYAGPDAGDDGTEVGTVYIGIGSDCEEKIYKFLFKGGRNRIRNYAANRALVELLKVINK